MFMLELFSSVPMYCTHKTLNYVIIIPSSDTWVPTRP
jgi:hypothetical protein